MMGKLKWQTPSLVPDGGVVIEPMTHWKLEGVEGTFPEGAWQSEPIYLDIDLWLEHGIYVWHDKPPKARGYVATATFTVTGNERSGI